MLLENVTSSPSATIVKFPSLNMAPPLYAVLFFISEFLIVAAECSLVTNAIAPPTPVPVAEFPVKVLFVIVALLPYINIAPPRAFVEFSLKVLLSMVIIPDL